MVRTGEVIATKWARSVVIAHPIQAVHPSLALYAFTYSASDCVPRPQENSHLRDASVGTGNLMVAYWMKHQRHTVAAMAGIIRKPCLDPSPSSLSQSPLALIPSQR